MMTLAGFRLTGGMRIVLALAVVLAAAALGPLAESPAEPSSDVRVIVELDSPAALAEVAGVGAPSPVERADVWERAGDRAAALRQDHQELLRRAARAGLGLEVVHELTAAYNGIVAEVPAADVDELAAMPGVRAVHEDTVYEHALNDSVPLVSAPDVWEQADPDGVPVTGAGIVVAVVDTGIDYTHPDLGGGFAPDHKVVAGHDFVNDDADPMDDNGHGTHVAGIVAANGKVRGVAPDATLTAYKVLNQSGNGQLSDIIAGLDAAVDPANPHRADVVNMSLSGPGDGTDPLSVAARQAVDAGVVVAAAAGNAGPGPQSVRSPAAADGVLAVGASVSGVRVPRARMVEPAQEDLHAVRFDISGNPPDVPIQLDVVDVDRGLPGSYDDIDVTGKAVLINQTRPAPELALHAEERGAAAVFLYFPDFWGFVPESAAQPAVGPSGAAPDSLASDAFATGVDETRLGIPLMQIPGASAAAVQTHLASGDVLIELTGVDATDQLADFSSRGPSGLFTAKPNLVAPGVEILSTFPGETYVRGSGTSMATPHVAGAAALLRQLHPDWEAAQVSAALAGTAQRVEDGGPLDQGAGRLDIAAAAHTGLVAEPSSLSFGLADLAGDRASGTQKLSLTNIGADPVSGSLSVVPHSGTAASVTVVPDTVQLGPGERIDVEVRVELPPPDVDTDVTGWVVVDDGARAQSVPYLLAVRHLGVHATPDPAPATASTAVFVRSPAELSAPPAVEVTCPGLAVQRPEAQPFGTSLWRAAVQVADSGTCQVNTTGAAHERYGAPMLTGAGAFEAVAAPGPGRGVDMWQPIGPNAASGWQAFDITHNRNQMAIVPLASPSAFVSGDRMQTWRELRTMPMAGGLPASIATHPRNGGQLYVAVNGGNVDGSYRGRIMHSVDGGASWRILPGPDEAVRILALDDSGRALAAGTDTGVRITADNGVTWTEVPSTWSGLRGMHWIGTDLYLGTNSGLLVIRDAAGPKPGEPEVLFVPPGPGLPWAGEVAGDEETLIVARWPSPWLYASKDGGATFEQIFQTTGISIETLELVGDDIYALQGSRNLWIGHDRGAEWESWGDPAPNAIEFDLGRTPWSDEVLVSSGGGLYATDEPGGYQRVGVPGIWVYDLATAAGDEAAGEVLVAGTTADTFRSSMPRRAGILPEDLEWESSGGEGSNISVPFIATSPADPSVVYKVVPGPFSSFGIYRSDDGGATWDLKSTPSEAPRALLVHPADPDRIYVSYVSLTGEGLVASTDGGETWRKLHQGRTFGALAGDPTDADRIWAGEAFGRGREGLWLSEDGGLSFERLSDMSVTAIAVDPANPERLIVGGRGLHTSSDGGQTLAPADHVDLDMWVTDVVFAPGDSSRVFAAAGAFYDELGALKGGRGVLASEDGGTSWESLTTGLSNPNVTSLALDSDGQYLFAGIGGGSVHRIKLDD